MCIELMHLEIVQKKKMGGGIFGSIIGAAAGACSCGPIGFAVISTFGAAALCMSLSVCVCFSLSHCVRG